MASRSSSEKYQDDRVSYTSVSELKKKKKRKSYTMLFNEVQTFKFGILLSFFLSFK